MSNIIKVPYMPISEFKIPDNFFEETEELDEENPVFDNRTGLCKNTLLVITSLGMEKYIDVFKKRKIQLDTLLKLNETDLKELGITDPNDIANFLQKLGTRKESSDGEFIVKENHIEDLQIARNVQRQLVLMQNYCAYVELQMKKNKMTDYKVSSTEFASIYLKAFTEAALLQAQIMSKRIYDESSDDTLIDKILKKYDLTLPPVYKKVLPAKKNKGSSIVKKVVIVIGVSSLVVIIGKLILSSKRF